VARRLSGERPAAIYCSGLSRAYDTATAIQSAIASHPELRIDGRLTEGHFGQWQGKTYDSLKVHDAERLRKWEEDRRHVAPPDGESLAAIAERVQAAYSDICAEARDRAVIIVGTGDLFRCSSPWRLGCRLRITGNSGSPTHLCLNSESTNGGDPASAERRKPPDSRRVAMPH